MFLARSGRPEVKTCIKGLEQYSYAYEEAYQQAQWMQRVYAEVIDPSNRNPQLQSHHSHRPAQTHPLHHSSLSSSSSSMNSTGAAGMDPASAISIYMSMNSEGGSNPSLHEVRRLFSAQVVAYCFYASLLTLSLLLLQCWTKRVATPL